MTATVAYDDHRDRIMYDSNLLRREENKDFFCNYNFYYCV